ncbi:T9SS type A sorting domain-containing protein [uncultured Tenacibaculum sp.]|uniref:T9SS type A sorting domain-containing protein n=1 Tax=uncultured Tenacibaculum sp. TaxID=174713 RepID=UPI00262F9D77|nr:T9SS type A sorting domain-containing protein [uncultured Tenacibaculum sp.]
MKFKKDFLLLMLFYSTFLSAQNVDIPDNNFKKYLVENNRININMDTEISVTEAENFADEIEITNAGVTNLKGIEAFINLNKFISTGNQLVNNVNFTSNKSLSSIAISNASNLDNIIIGDNNNLTSISIQLTSIKSLDVSGATSLLNLRLQNNELTSLNIRNGNNTNMALMGTVNLLGNNLSCVQIDNGLTPPTNGTLNWSYDSTTQFSTNCSTLSTESFNYKSKIIVYPNPSSEFIQIDGLNDLKSLKIYSLTGRLLYNNLVFENKKVKIDHLSSGIYYLIFDNKLKIKFIKK